MDSDLLKLKKLPENIESALHLSGHRQPLVIKSDDTWNFDDTNVHGVFAVDLEGDHKGTKIHLRGQTAVDSPYPPLIIVHDFGANHAHYRHFAHELYHSGLSVYCYDLRGHGQSGKMMGHISHFSALVNDLLQVSAWVRHREGGQTPVIIGHGFGCLIAVTLQQRFPKYCRSMVLLSPSLKLRYGLGKFASVCVRTIADIHPRIRLPAALTPRFYSLLNLKSSEQLSDVPKEKLNTFTRITAQSGKQILNALETAQSRFLRIKAPALVILGERDAIIDHSIFPELMKRHKRSELITLMKIPDASHNLITENEPFAPQICDEICSWLSDQRLGGPQP